MSVAFDQPLPGYQKKPLAITVVAAIFLALPLVVLVQVWILAGGSTAVLAQVVGSAYFLQEWVLAWSAAAAVFVVSRASFIYFLILSGYVVGSRLARLLLRPDLEPPMGLALTVVWLGMALYVVGSSLRRPYLNPRLRWWTRPMRISLATDATITVHGLTLPVQLLNLSVGGAFVRVDEASAAHAMPPQQVGEALEFAAALVPATHPKATSWQFATSAEVVWRGKPDSPYRHGFGIRFVGLTRRQRRQLRRVIRDAIRR